MPQDSHVFRKRRYFYMDRDVDPEHPPPVQERPPVGTFDGNKVKFYIDGEEYFSAVYKEINRLLASTAEGRFFYLSGWWLGLIEVDRWDGIVEDTGERLDERVKIKIRGKNKLFKKALKFKVDVDNSAFIYQGVKLADRLVEMHDAGIDVRVLGWISPFMLRWKQVAMRGEGIAELNLHTLFSALWLRDQKPELAKKVVLNTVGHPFGGSHFKMVICGDKTEVRAYTGGIDAESGRLSATPTDNNWDPPRDFGWHDIAVRVKGPAAYAMHNFYADMWNEQIGREPERFQIDGRKLQSHESGTTPQIVVRDPTTAPVHEPLCSVQVLRTLPTINVGKSGLKLPGVKVPVVGKPVRRFVKWFAEIDPKPLTFAPKGLFEFKSALLKAISSAQRYVFMMDQAFSNFEVMDALNARIKACPNLKVILVHGSDPADPPSGNLAEAIDRHLCVGLDNTQLGRIRFHAWDGVCVHGKVTLIDDIWCAVGSANCMRRSFYTDIELSVGIVDTTGDRRVKRFRRDLWARYCGIPSSNWASANQKQQYQDMFYACLALGIWDPTWEEQLYKAGSNPQVRVNWRSGRPSLLTSIVSVPVPFNADDEPFNPEQYRLEDPDSRERF